MRIGRWILARIREFVTLLVLGALALWLLPDLLARVVQKARRESLPSAGWGLVTVLVGYLGAALIAGLIIAIGVLLAVITLGGLARTWFGITFSTLALTFALFSLLVTFGSKLVVAYLGGDWLLARLSPESEIHRFWPLLLGVAIYVVLRGVPLLGWIFGVIVTLVGLGAMWLVYREWRAPAAQAATG
ncbi:MAG: hypothetical protein GTO53_01960 [Planctomycetales bacterium]|nr:hypothetical protein [Planctomycetales bacterium]NIN09164.1 hypothetical protein [Planctomycetales bacterium]NIP05342.1 hypothetical protein [Planctomycetales bacterium]